MKIKITTTVICTVLFTALTGAIPAVAGDAKADLRASIDKIAKAQTFSLEAERRIDPKLVESAAVPVEAKVKLLVQRPNKLRVEITGKDVDRCLYFDGKKVTIADNKASVYAEADAPGTLDDLITAIEDKLGFTPPLADLVVSDPWPRFVTDDTKLEAKGEVELEGVKCKLLKGSEKGLIDWSMWLDAGTSLPRLLVVSATAIEGKPELSVKILKIDLAAKASDADFTHTPAEGAKKAKIELGKEKAEAKKE